MEKAKIWQQEIEIPTYTVSEPCDYPMFLENRVYQGSSGKVYPNKIIEKIHDTKVMKTYQAVFLENTYIQIMILPELGGRVQRAYDKTNGYDFVYYNQVIKPALVGLTGPWLSGGIEFNWPQHHRPSTFDPMAYRLETHEDRVTLWVGEIEKMSRTKGQAGFTLYHDKAYLEITGQIYNRTPQYQTFLWWANPAVSVNASTRTIFPPDVTAVMDHGKRDVTTFPIATTTYYKVDYSEGVDISLYKNIPVPTSYMSYHSDYDFLAFYDASKQAGLLHVANHHIAPGKKQWTWGCGEFGQAWDRHLTDSDGPYIELMTGCFTDNQPDFAWLAPFEEKCFKQYFMPYKTIGTLKNATKEGALAVEIIGTTLKVGLYVTSPYEAMELIFESDGEMQRQTLLSLSPLQGVFVGFHCPKEAASKYSLKLCNVSGQVVVDYHHNVIEGVVPQKAEAIVAPHLVETLEDLYLYGLHLEQYRHATRRPEDYYLEGLQRDPSDYRLNVAYGKRLMQRFELKQAKTHFQRAIDKITRSNPNPYDGEAYYQLGLVNRYLDADDLAYKAFYKCIWNQGMKASGYYHIAAIDYKQGRYLEALEAIEICLVFQNHHMKARHLKHLILLTLGKEIIAQSWLEASLEIDGLDVGLNWEKGEATVAKHVIPNEDTLIELVLDYIEWGAYDRAMACFKAKTPIESYMVYYYQAYVALLQGDLETCLSCMAKGAKVGVSGIFPYRIEDGLMLEALLVIKPEDGLALYGLGNLYYHHQWHEKAIAAFEPITALNNEKDMAYVYRNLSLLYYNQERDASKAFNVMEKAIACDPNSSHLRMEYDQLLKKCCKGPRERLLKLQGVMDLVLQGDALYLEYCTLLTLTGDFKGAIEAMKAFRFHPWEGGEGKTSTLYKWAQIAVALGEIQHYHYEKACERLKALKAPYPEFLGEGRLKGTLENHIDFWLGIAYKRLGDGASAKQAFNEATQGEVTLASAVFYNDQPSEMLFYQGLAHMQLGHVAKAEHVFKRLYDYGVAHREDEQTIDYFSVSIPDLQLFTDSLNVKNQVHCDFMTGLGALGLAWLCQKKPLSDQALKTLLQRDPNHLSLNMHVQMLDSNFLPQLFEAQVWQVTLGKNYYDYEAIEASFHPVLETKTVKAADTDISEVADKSSLYLPGTTDMARLGHCNEKQSNVHLMRRNPFIGKCVYEQVIDMPNDKAYTDLLLRLERTKKTKVYIDGQLVSEGEALSTSQIHPLIQHKHGRPPKERYTLSIEVDNHIDGWSETMKKMRHGHMLSEHTQTNWNGILGQIELLYSNPVVITDVSVKKEDDLEVHLHGQWDGEGYELKLMCEDTLRLWSLEACACKKTKEGQVLTLSKALEGLFLDNDLWSEHAPNLKTIQITLQKADAVIDTYTFSHGKRLVNQTKHHLCVNRVPLFLRGDIDCCIFPLTGAPPMDVHTWKQRFYTYKAYGLNHVRFHSWCPPKAAFEAADAIGLYLQVELSFFATHIEASDTTLQKHMLLEASQILDAYSKHPSFLILALGNEMDGDENVFNQMVQTIKDWHYPVIVASGANNFIESRSTLEHEGICITMRVPVEGRLENIRASFSHADLPLGYIQSQEAIGTKTHYDEALKGQPCPVISHEIGQYQVYPRFQEADAYTGVLHSTALEMFKAHLKAHPTLMAMAEAYADASGKMAYLCYKEELEAAHRSRYLAGFQLLSFYDFPGQGTALVGVYDSLFQSKHIVDEATWRQSCGPMVVLGLFDQYLWTSLETLDVEVVLVHHGDQELPPHTLSVQCGNQSQVLEISYVMKPGHAYTLGTVRFTFETIIEAEQVSLDIDYGGISNHYDLFVYPEIQTKLKSFEAECVIDDPLLFPTDFWNHPMFKAICLERGLRPAPGTMGLWIEKNHPIFSKFPTRYYGQWQWQRLMSHACPMDVAALRARYGNQVTPLVHVIDHFESGRELAILVELKNEGRILCSIDFTAGQDYPEFKCLYKSILKHIKKG